MSRESVEQRAVILRAFVAAGTRHAEVFAIVAAAPTEHDARVAVARLLGIDEVAARAVLELGVRRFTEDSRRRIADELATVEAQLRDL